MPFLASIFIFVEAVKCPSAPKYQDGTKVYGLTDWDPTIDEAIYEAVAQYTCPEGYVFQIYQDDPDPEINFGLIEDETAELNVTCAAFADWTPSPVPPCIRKPAFPFPPISQKNMIYFCSHQLY